MRHAITLVITLILLLLDSCALNPSNDTKFQEAMRVVYLHEGGLSNHPNDRGLLTKYGISLAFIQKEHIDVDGDGDVDVDDIYALTLKKSDQIYFDKFWIPNGYERINNSKMAIKIMDTAINTGASQANKLLKRSINVVYEKNIAVNGILDGDTVKLLNLLDNELIIEEFRKQQANFYNLIIKKNHSYKVFRNGWMNRAKS